ncbi:MAG TPA: YHS domain-containing protein, partial [Pontiella sp.]
MEHNHTHEESHLQALELKDPVCGMDVDPEKTEHHFTFENHDYHFCSEHCLHNFKDSPKQYLEKKEGFPIAAGTIYICPMHPEIEQVDPGTCPICGMALEPKNVAEGEEDITELKDMTLRFWVSAVLSVPVLLLVML